MPMINQRFASIEEIDPNPYQTRGPVDPISVDELAKSILADGLMQVPTGRNTEEIGRAHV